MMLAEANVRAGEADQRGDQGQQPAAKRLGGLVLARQLGESIMIGDSVMVEILGLKSNSVRLRIVAPRSVAVHRREVYDAIRLNPRPVVEPPAPAAEPAAAGPPPAEGGLVLTRRAGQTVMIGSEVAVDVVEAKTGTVRLRIIAPRSISVHRREVYDSIRAGESRPG